MPNLRSISSAALFAIVSIGLAAPVEEQSNEHRIAAFSKLPAAERKKPEFLVMKLVAKESSERIATEPDRSKIKLADNEEIVRIEHAKQGIVAYEWLIVEKPALLNRTHIAQCAAVFGKKGWELALEFTPEGKKVFGEVTQKAVGRRLALVLGGTFVLSAPNILEPVLDGVATMHGNLDESTARIVPNLIERH